MKVVHPRLGVEAVVARPRQLAREPRMNVNRLSRGTRLPFREPAFGAVSVDATIFLSAFLLAGVGAERSAPGSSAITLRE
jgi:hypothetical protein